MQDVKPLTERKNQNVRTNPANTSRATADSRAAANSRTTTNGRAATDATATSAATATDSGTASADMTEELQAKVDQFTADLNNANIAFVLAIAVSGQTPRWWTNLQRYTGSAADAIRHALNEAGRSVVARKRPRNGQLIITR